MRRSQSGISTVELLIAGAILIVLLTAALGLYASTVRASRVTEEVSEERQGVQAITALLQYEIGLAGYRCADSSAATRQFTGKPLQVVDGASGAPDTVVVSYYEDRYVTGCVLTKTEYSVSNGSLMRKVGTAAAETMVAGVTDLQVTQWLNRANSSFAVPATGAGLNRPPDADLRGIGLELSLETSPTRIDTVQVTIGLKNPQCSVLADCL
jgi:Tfp pilus assembly protein PilW